MNDVDKAWKHFELYEAECKQILQSFERERRSLGEGAGPISGPIAAAMKGGDLPKQSIVPLLSAYDLCLKSSHLFNILDARGAISVTERVGVIARVRALAVGIAKAWVDQQSQVETPAPEEEEPAAKEIRAKKRAEVAPTVS